MSSAKNDKVVKDYSLEAAQTRTSSVRKKENSSQNNQANSSNNKEKDSKMFKFSNREEMYSHSKPYKLFLIIGSTLFLLVTLILSITLGLVVNPSFFIFFVLAIILVNLFLIMFIGRQVVRSIWFPYGSKLITLAMDGQTNERFGEEFIKILERTHSILQNKMIQNQKSDDADQIINEEEFWNQTATHTQHLMSACEVLALYSSVNQECIQKDKEKGLRKNRQFENLTQIMIDIIEILKQFIVEIKPIHKRNGQLEEIQVPLWEIYCQNESIDMRTLSMLYDMRQLPKIVQTDKTQLLMDQFWKLTQDFRSNVMIAIRPFKCCCCRTAFMLFQKGIFGTLDQLQLMLEKNYDGKHFWIKSQTDKNHQIDSMVFPSTSEKVLSSKELEDYRNSNEGKDPDYISRPTIICCNPNALFYHHMVNAPNNYWLSFYLKKGINVVAWNYRGYGNTKGSCTPYNVRSDGESVLYFVTNELGIKGKIGVYGRSLGGICATHLAATYPDKIELLIADRTFGNFKDISLRKFPGQGTSYLFDLITLQWEAQNDLNFLNAQCFKISTSDNTDDVVDQYACLTARVASIAYRKLLKLKPFLSEPDRISSFNLCQLAFQLETFIFEQLPNCQEDLMNEDLDSIVIDFKNDSFEKEVKRKIQRGELRLEEIIAGFKGCKGLRKIHHGFHHVIVIMGDISGGVIRMSDIFAVNQSNHILNYELYLANLFAYGSGYCDHKSGFMVHKRLNQIEIAKNEIQILITILKETIAVVEVFKGHHTFVLTVSLILNSLRSYFEALLNYMNTELYESDGKTLIIKDEHVGFLIPMKCGHRGKPSRIEERDLETLLRQSNFLESVSASRGNKFVPSIDAESPSELSLENQKYDDKDDLINNPLQLEQSILSELEDVPRRRLSNSITSSTRQALKLVEQFENASRNSEVELNDVKMEFEDEGLQGISDKKQKTITDESVTIVKSSRVKNVSEIELEQNK